MVDHFCQFRTILCWFFRKSLNRYSSWVRANVPFPSRKVVMLIWTRVEVEFSAEVRRVPFISIRQHQAASVTSGRSRHDPIYNP